MIKNIIIYTLCFAILCSFASLFTAEISAIEFADLPSTENAKCVYFYNIDTKKSIIKKGAGTAIPPASATKIMTGLIACELLETRLNERITVTKEMIYGVEGTSMRLAEGDILSVSALLYGAVCGGFNDAAYALASVCAGSRSDFVKMMNERASELGARSTIFVNPTGFDAGGQRTTLDDIAKIAKTAMNNELYMKISSTVSVNIDFYNGKSPKTIYNRNGLISTYYVQGQTNKSAEGMIAGVTDLGGNCVITKATIKGNSYLCVIMGANTPEEAYSLANSLIAYAKYNLISVTLCKQGELICTIPVDFALDGTATTDNADVVNVRTAKDAQAFLPSNLNYSSHITQRYHLYSKRLTAPISSGTVVGTLDFFYDDEHIASVPLTVNADVTENSFLIKMDSMKKILTSRTTIISILAFVLIFTFRQLYFRSHKRKSVKEIKMKRYNSKE